MTLNEMKEFLGNRYLMHPDNQVKKIRRKKTTFQKVVDRTVRAQIRHNAKIAGIV